LVNSSWYCDIIINITEYFLSWSLWNCYRYDKTCSFQCMLVLRNYDLIVVMKAASENCALVGYYAANRGNNPERHSSQLLCGRSVKSCNTASVNLHISCRQVWMNTTVANNSAILCIMKTKEFNQLKYWFTMCWFHQTVLLHSILWLKIHPISYS
jgi:hypothetical protein